jgi:hypothetical protein
MVWIRLTWLRTGTEGSSEHGNEIAGSTECCEVREWLHNWRRLLKKGSDP